MGLQKPGAPPKVLKFRVTQLCFDNTSQPLPNQHLWNGILDSFYCSQLYFTLHYLSALSTSHSISTNQYPAGLDFPDSKYLNDSGNGKIYRRRRYRSLYYLYTKVFCRTNF